MPTFNKDVAPILFKNCVKCHQLGELASGTPLTSYEAAKARAELIKQKVASQEMPPWPADPAKSLKFRNDPRLNQREIDTIVAWVNGGAPKGNDADLPPLPKLEEGWSHPQKLKPDFVVSPPTDVHLPATGAIRYVRIMVKVPFTEDKWVAASQTKPSNPAVVHHMALTEVALPEGMTPSDVAQLSHQMGFAGAALDTPVVTTPTNPPKPDMLAIYTPGSTLEMYGENNAKLLKGGKNMYIVFNIHYETTGKPETDRSRIALWFARKAPQHQLFRVNGAGETVLANGKELLADAPGIKAEGTAFAIPPIPPFAKNYELTGITAYMDPVTIYQLQPHAHHRGKDFTYTIVYPDGREQTLLSVPKYDHRWQMAYELETPLELPAGSKMVVTAHYDNSKMNMHNPTPEKEVYFRDMNQSWDEMFTPFIQYSIDGQNGKGEAEGAGGSQEQKEAKAGRLGIGEVVGCLEARTDGKWMLTHGSQPALSDTQSTTSAALRQAEARPLSDQRYLLLGVNIFNPSSHRGGKVAVKGVVIPDANETRINVTSLQEAGAACAP
ncbi:MAG: c-type cytochrome [Acidobacteria bacterium]|nr:c-type cytochrome [Acidobacteriota bacterium]MBS1865602.1 c-type cytochrome [Acidobacteriota bacterium]